MNHEDLLDEIDFLIAMMHSEQEAQSWWSTWFDIDDLPEVNS